jgi:hypothetical protein
MHQAQAKSKAGAGRGAEAGGSRAASAPGLSTAQAQRTPAYALAQDAPPALSLLGGAPQFKLAVGQPDDPAEREADAVADTIASGSTVAPKAIKPLTPSPTSDEEERPEQTPAQRQTSGEGAGGGSNADVAAGAIARGGDGSPMSASVRDPLESGMGVDLGDVRVHNDEAAHEAASALGARAFAYREGIWLGRGESETDVRLMAHEAAHSVQQRGGSEMIRRDNGDGGGGGAPAAPPPPAPPAPAPAPGQGQVPAPAPAGAGGAPVPTLAPGSGTEYIMPELRFPSHEESVDLFSLPLAYVPFWIEPIPLPPPLFFATAVIDGRITLKFSLFYRVGPITLRDIRMYLDPTADRYTGTGQLLVPLSAGPKLTLKASLSAHIDWLGMPNLEALAVEGGFKAVAQAPLILAPSLAVRFIYDHGNLTFTARPQVDAGVAFIFDAFNFIEARILQRKIWEKRWYLYHWHWGRAVRLGTNLSLDYENGQIQPPRVEPYAERFSIEELMDALREPLFFAPNRPVVLGPDTRPFEERLRDLLAGGPIDGEIVLAILAEGTDAEKAALLADPVMLAAVRSAVGYPLWTIGERILNNTPSETVPSLDEGTVFLTSRHIRAGRFPDALNVVVNKLTQRGIIVPSLVDISYESVTTRGEGLTTTDYDVDPLTGVRTPSGPARMYIYDPAFVNVPWLYSTIMHEYVHVLQQQRPFTAPEFTDPEGTTRDEVEAYLWEVEHSRGSGVIVSSSQMREIGRRLTEHYNALSPASQLPYRDRYNAAMDLVRQATSGVIPVHLTFTIEDARRRVQEISQEIAALVRQRPDTGDREPTPDERREQDRIDREIAALEATRSESLVEVVLAENPNVQIVDRARGIYRVPVTDGSGHVQWLYGTITVVWHIRWVSPAVFSIRGQIGARPPATLPPGTTVTPRLSIGGSGIQTAVQPFPGDIDYVEEFSITAPTREAASTAMADTIIEFVTRNAANPDLEFVRLRIMPPRRSGVASSEWTRDQILNIDAAGRERLAQQLATVSGGRINTDWRATLDGGRFIVVTKVLSISAVSSTSGAELFSTERAAGPFQEADFEDLPRSVAQMTTGEYAALMRRLAINEADRGHWLKAAKRAFNYFRTIGNLQAMSLVTPVFSTDQARVNQNVAELEAVEDVLTPGTTRRPGVPTSILSADAARARLNEAADVVEALLPAPPVDRSRIANELRAIAAAIQGVGGDPTAPVQQDGALARQLNGVREEIGDTINTSLENTVRPIIDDHVR